MSIALLLLITAIIAAYAIISLIIKKDKQKRDVIFLILSAIILLIFLFIRINYLDLVVYAKDFYFLNNCSWADFWEKAYEPFYKIFNFLVGRFTNDPKILFCIIDIIGLMGPLFFIYKNSKNKLLSILIYISIGSFAINQSALRQVLAVSIVTFSFDFVIKKKKIPFLLSIIFASLFHYTAITALLIYPAYNWSLRKISKKIFWPCIFIVSTLIGGLIMQIIMQFDKYKSYADTEFIIGNTGYRLLVLYIVIGLTIYLLLVYLCKEKATENEKRLLNVFMLCITFQILATQVAIMNRVTSYFVNTLIVLIPNSIAIIEDRKRRTIIHVSAFVATIGLTILNNNFNSYITIFNPPDNNIQGPSNQINDGEKQ